MTERADTDQSSGPHNGSGPESGLGHVTGLYRYPVKGLSAESLGACDLVAGDGIPFDRMYAIENGPGRFDPNAPRHLPKTNFLMLMRNERLATLETRFDPDTHILTVLRQGRQVARGALRTRLGRQMVEQFFSAYMKDALRGPPRIVSSEGQNFTFADVPAKCLHVVNLATVRDLERAAGKPVHPLRFRANVYIDGLEPWEEFRWVGKQIAVGSNDAGLRLSVVERTVRCDNINVDPRTAARDMGLPAVLSRSWGHTDLGVYATVVRGGTIATGQPIRLHAD